MWQCRKCGKPVYFAERKQSLGFDWHPKCLRCEECGKRLNPGQHAEHKGVPYCHHPCYGALFGPQLFGHGTRNECHTSFGRVENRDGNVKRGHLESKLKVYNQFYDGRPGELKSRQANGRLILEGVLKIYWGVSNVIHLKEEDDQRTIVKRRTRYGDSPKHAVTTRRNNNNNNNNKTSNNDAPHSDSDEEGSTLWRDDSPNPLHRFKQPQKTPSTTCQIFTPPEETNLLPTVTNQLPTAQLDAPTGISPRLFKQQNSSLVDVTSWTASPFVFPANQEKKTNGNCNNIPNRIRQENCISSPILRESPRGDCISSPILRESPRGGLGLSDETHLERKVSTESVVNCEDRSSINGCLASRLGNDVAPIEITESFFATSSNDLDQSTILKSPIRDFNNSGVIPKKHLYNNSTTNNVSNNDDDNINNISNNDVSNTNYTSTNDDNNTSTNTIKDNSNTNRYTTTNRESTCNDNNTASHQSLLDGHKDTNNDDVTQGGNRSHNNHNTTHLRDSTRRGLPVDFVEDGWVRGRRAVTEDPPSPVKTACTAIRRRPGRRMDKTKLKRRCSINGHWYLRETSTFTPPRGSPCSVWASSLVTTAEILKMLLEKYKVEMSHNNFALFVVRDSGEQRRVRADESPLVVRVMLGPREDVARLFIMDAQRTPEISSEVADFINLSLTECRAILMKYEEEEQVMIHSLKKRYTDMRRFIQHKLKKLNN